MIVELSVIPIGVGESLSKYIAEIIKFFEKKGIKHQITSMGTIFEIEDYVKLGNILQEINEILIKLGVGRVYMVIKSDFRVKESSMEYKVKSVMEKLK